MLVIIRFPGRGQSGRTFPFAGDGAPNELMMKVAEGRARTNLSTANHMDPTFRLADDPAAMLPGGLTQEHDLVVGPAVTILCHVMVTALF